MTKHDKNGRSFEYSFIVELKDQLNYHGISAVIVENNPYRNAMSCFDKIDDIEKLNFIECSRKAIKHIVQTDHFLLNSSLNNGEIELEIQSDARGRLGDVRDIVAKSPYNNHEVGFSLKNNHSALKHSRLSPSIDFGKDWLSLCCSTCYFDNINKIFSELKSIIKENPGARWDEYFTKESKYNLIYTPLLNAFKDELIYLHETNPETVSKNIFEYFIGTHDYYKIIKRKNTHIDIFYFNTRGKLNHCIFDDKSSLEFTKNKLPNRILNISFKDVKAKNTLYIEMDNSWDFSLRLHNASSKIQTSLKFDINFYSDNPVIQKDIIPLHE